MYSPPAVADSGGLTLSLLALYYISRRRFAVLLQLVCAVFTGYVDAQVPDTVWTRTFGRSWQDHGYSVQQTTNRLLAIGG